MSDLTQLRIVEIARDEWMRRAIAAESVVQELQAELFDISKLCHKYQNELWADSKSKASQEKTH
jgi:hypothetical protein